MPAFRRVPHEIRARAQLRYQILVRVTTLRLSHSHGEIDPMRLLGSIRDGIRIKPQPVSFAETTGEDRQPSKRNIVQENAFSVGATSFRRGRSAREKIRPFCVYSIQRAYGLDGGVPYPRNADPNILVIDEPPSSRFDPFKPVRCANFAGWAVTRAGDSREVTELAERISGSYQKHEL